MSARVALGLCLCAPLVGCGADERVGASRGPFDAGADAHQDAPVGEAGPPIRSVELRNPFGSADPDNLLVDGDFELTSGSGQFGWRAIGSGGEGILRRETGGLCRSGVSCGVLTPETDLLALAARPGDSDLLVVLWAKPPSSDCTLTVVSLIQCTSPFVVTLADVSATNPAPDASGWCEYRGVAPATEQRPCLLVSSFEAAEQRTLIDAASLGAAPPSAPRTIGAGAPRAEVAARARRAVRVVHESTRFGRPPPARP